jgi:TRAP transporter TAXI family solute receptor
MMPRLKSWLFFVRVQWPLILAVLLVLMAFYLTLQFVEPPPPKHLTLAAGPKGGGYDYYARQYAEALAKQGVTLQVLETKGSLDNMHLLQKADSGIDVVFAQAGVGWMAGVYEYDADESSIRSLAEIYDEPLWIFTRIQEPFALLRDLKSRRLAVGQPGSGVHALATDLLKWSGVTPQNAVFLELPQEEAVQALKDGKADAAFFVGGTGSPFLRRCTADPALRLHSFGDAAAYARRFNYLGAVTLPKGVLDLGLGVPPVDTVLVAPAATLLAREDLHPALVHLLLATAKKLHGGHSILSDVGQFPSAKNLEFPLHKDAARFFQSGPPWLQRYLPYHLAAFIDRTKILLLPLLTLLLPLIKIAYPTYRWSIRRNIWKWYRAISVIESDYYQGKGERNELLQRVRSLEARVARMQIPFSYASELYTLRQHIAMVRDMIERGEGGKGGS